MEGGPDQSALAGAGVVEEHATGAADGERVAAEDRIDVEEVRGEEWSRLREVERAHASVLFADEEEARVAGVDAEVRRAGGLWRERADELELRRGRKRPGDDVLPASGVRRASKKQKHHRRRTHEWLRK
jgi:hypothetical protein